MYCLYMLCRGILVIVPRQELLKILKLGAQKDVAPDDRTLPSERPDSADSGFSELPFKR